MTERQHRLFMTTTLVYLSAAVLSIKLRTRRIIFFICDSRRKSYRVSHNNMPMNSRSGFLFVTVCFAFLLAITAITAVAQTNVSAVPGGIHWSDIRDLGVEGRGWNDTKSFYDRLPAKAEGVVRKPVWDLSRNS